MKFKLMKLKIETHLGGDSPVACAAATASEATTTATKTAEAATLTARNTWNATHTVASAAATTTRISSLCGFLLALGILAGRTTRSCAAKTPRLTYAHVDSEEAWTLAKIARDECLARSRI